MSSLHIRIDEPTKRKVQKILKELGLDMSTAVNMYFHKIALTKSIPFPIEMDAEVSAKLDDIWEREIQEAIKEGASFDSSEELHKDILGSAYA
ncbi:MAG: type II toxin-antitoxin system RelB/DinJ family antitoxin [bacterium]|nr:type II toxin-antitoxin system RelB/DinJ family antitoxin [bacterium]